MSRKVLLADTNQESLHRMITLFSAQGHQVVVTGNGADTHRECAAGRFDLVIIASTLAGGAVVADVVSCSQGAAVLVTAPENNRKLERDVRNKGVDYYLPGPFSMTELRDVADALFRMHDRRVQGSAGARNHPVGEHVARESHTHET